MVRSDRLVVEDLQFIALHSFTVSSSALLYRAYYISAIAFAQSGASTALAFLFSEIHLRTCEFMMIVAVNDYCSSCY